MLLIHFIIVVSSDHNFKRKKEIYLVVFFNQHP